MQQGWGLKSYQGRQPVPWGAVPIGCCRKCGQPFGCRDCRKEARSLLVTDQQQAVTGALAAGVQSRAGTSTALPTGMAAFVNQNTGNTELKITDETGTAGTDFIGGECCVTLSVEYAATVATAAFLVIVFVIDSEGTILAWARLEKAGTNYRVHERIITTKPGAKLTVVALNCTVRARWCEVFSC